MLCTFQEGSVGLSELHLNGKSVLDVFSMCGARFYTHGGGLHSAVPVSPLLTSMHG